jgi:hypothetical protein
MHISPDMKQRALQLPQHMEYIVEALGVSERSIGRWADNFAYAWHLIPYARSSQSPGRVNLFSWLQTQPRDTLE